MPTQDRHAGSQRGGTTAAVGGSIIPLPDLSSVTKQVRELVSETSQVPVNAPCTPVDEKAMAASTITRSATPAAWRMGWIQATAANADNALGNCHHPHTDKTLLYLFYYSLHFTPN